MNTNDTNTQPSEKFFIVPVSAITPEKGRAFELHADKDPEITELMNQTMRDDGKASAEIIKRIFGFFGPVVEAQGEYPTPEQIDNAANDTTELRAIVRALWEKSKDAAPEMTLRVAMALADDTPVKGQPLFSAKGNVVSKRAVSKGRTEKGETFEIGFEVLNVAPYVDNSEGLAAWLAEALNAGQHPTDTSEEA